MTGGSRRPELASFAALITGRGRCARTAGLSHSVAQNRKVARPERFERPTLRFVVKKGQKRWLRELGNRTSFAPETTPSKRNKRDRNQTKT
jgi:hypothetical protein